jgi:hypothetical protein
MAIDPHGYCTQCRTFRGQVQQPVHGAAPYPPGYPQYPPTSGAPYPGQSSGVPYPHQISGPPISGAPGYPPPPPPRRSFLGILIASIAVLVVLIGAVVVVAIVRGGKPDPTPTLAASDGTASPTASATIDSCLVGTWTASSDRQQISLDDIGSVTLIGKGTVAHFHPDGFTEVDYDSAVPYQGSANGHTVRITVKGRSTSRISTSGNTMSFRDLKADGTLTAEVDGTSTGTSVPLELTDDPVQYTCSGNTATEHTSQYDVTFIRTSSNP